MIKKLFAGMMLLAAAPAAAKDCASDQRALDHYLLDGTVCVPADPQRIAFTMEEIINAYVMGGESVVDNAYFQSFRKKYPGILAEDKVPSVDIRSYPRADVETLTLANPDVIVAFAGIENNEKAKTLAPMVEILWLDDTTWRDLHHFMAYFLNVEAEGKAALDALDARMARLKSDLGDTPRSFAIARAGEEAGTIQVFTEKNFGAVVLQQAGMVPGDGVLSSEEAAKVGSKWNYHMSVENLEALDVDHFFLMEGLSEENGAALLKSDLWQALPMVKEGRVISVPSDGQQFIRENIAYAHLVIDLVYEGALGKTAADAGNPNPLADWLPK